MKKLLIILSLLIGTTTPQIITATKPTSSRTAIKVGAGFMVGIAGLVTWRSFRGAYNVAKGDRRRIRLIETALIAARKMSNQKLRAILIPHTNLLSSACDFSLKCAGLSRRDLSPILVVENPFVANYHNQYRQALKAIKDPIDSGQDTRRRKLLATSWALRGVAALAVTGISLLTLCEK